ncbi:bifunctional phosphoribosylaminoimidazolecarboxamide formyltransferase/IMP cyclohydrolase PurH [Clostridiales bacterium COT073_COT-073]|nr:bifunctional phosphoribosylaminoimidazolecarboxamide formyltransferase/IMP cyclohydrolase PurH [Clostridiales bacterium COT073_COT-073]
MARRALISVSDKTGIAALAADLKELGFEILSTGGTAKTLMEQGVEVTEVSAVTGFPECLDGRVKTLDPHIHAGLLARRADPEHMQQIHDLNIKPIDVVVVNLYPFKQTILKPGVELADAIENIDIGGPTMLRSAAKNYQDVSVVVDPADYQELIKHLREKGQALTEFNFYLAAKVFTHTANYDALIAGYLNAKINRQYPETLTLTFEKKQALRYGENPHQTAAYYQDITTEKGLLTGAEQLHGKELSYNNINDTNGALELCKEFEMPTVVACKHSNPCGVGTAETIYEAYQKAYSSDPKSIFGGIIVANREIDAATAAEINKIFIEIVLAPGFSQEAFAILSAKKNIRLLQLPELAQKNQPNYDIRKVSGGLLIQEKDDELLWPDKLRCVTDRQPTAEELEDLKFTWKLAKYVKSNGIAIGKAGQSLGLGTGQVNRIWAAEQAIEHCQEALGAEVLHGAVLASDAFFPFADCVEVAAKAGITAIIQPGGSVHDQDSIDLCNRHNIAMIFTEIRHFRH